MCFDKVYKCDILVAGGGVAGVAAALEAARCGKKVILLEKTTQLGGLATIGLINLFVPMCNGRGIQIIKGMADEFLRLSIKYGFDTIPPDWKNGEPGLNNTKQRLLSEFSAPIFSLLLCELLHENNVEIFFDTVLTDVKAENGHIESVTAFNKSGYSLFEASVFIDTTGDADLLYKAGVPTVTGANYNTYFGFKASIESCKKVVETNDFAHLAAHAWGGNASMYGDNHPQGLKTWDGTNGNDVSDYLVLNQLKLLDNIKNDNRNERDIITLPNMVQFRTTRRIDGDFTLTTDNVYEHFEDSVCAICDFDNLDYLYEVPYRTLVNSGFDNVITAGRCASAEGYAWDILRVIPPAILTGQVAGAASSLSINSNTSINDIDISTLQAQLENENVLIHFNDDWVSSDC